MTRLHELFERGGQSPWLDNLKRSYLRGGQLARYLEAGVRGVTSNPTIMARAIEGSDDYDEQFRACLSSGSSVEDAYWDLVVEDVEGALSLLRPLHDGSGGRDGFVSIEVAPRLAHDAKATVEAARELHRRIDAPNLLVKIPATEEGVAAVEAVIGEGRNVNVTLVFSLERYEQVVGAYLSGLEAFAAAGGRLERVASVASFFVSRVDTEVDRRLEAIAADPATPDATRERARRLRGKAAVAQARLAYATFRRLFAGPRWEALSARGARVQRPLWASTSTKNPSYPDLAYVETLIGPDTVTTMPDETIAAFLDHGHVARTVDEDLERAQEVLTDLEAVGVPLADVAATLEREGVAAFERSFDEVIDRLSAKAAVLGGRR